LKNLFPTSPFSSADVLAKQFSASCTVEKTSDGKDSNYFAPLPTVEDDFDHSTIASLPQPQHKAKSTPGSDDEADKHAWLLDDPLEECFVFLEYAAGMDALLSDVKRIWERAASDDDECTVMYAALYTKCSMDMALYFTDEVVEELGLEDFQWLETFHEDIMMNFNPVELHEMRCPIKYSQFTKEGAFLAAVMDPGEKFLDNLLSMTPRPKKMMSPKSYIPWQTACGLPDIAVPSEIVLSRDPMALPQYVKKKCAEADRITANRSRAIVLLMEDMEHLRQDMLYRSQKSSVDSLTIMEIGLVDFQMKPLLSGLENLIESESINNYRPEFNI